jgi:hypothetical protein
MAQPFRGRPLGVCCLGMVTLFLRCCATCALLAVLKKALHNVHVTAVI